MWGHLPTRNLPHTGIASLSAMNMQHNATLCGQRFLINANFKTVFGLVWTHTHIYALFRGLLKVAVDFRMFLHSAVDDHVLLHFTSPSKGFVTEWAAVRLLPTDSGTVGQHVKLYVNCTVLPLMPIQVRSTHEGLVTDFATVLLIATVTLHVYLQVGGL